MTSNLEHPRNSGSTEAIILIKAAPVIGRAHGETVCCAGIDIYGNWLRLYPVAFRVLEDSQKFSRWDKVRFNWRKPLDDQRTESRRVDSQSLEIIGRLPELEKPHFLDSKIVTSLNNESSAGRSLALLKPEILEFIIREKAVAKIEEQQRKIDEFHFQSDMFLPRPSVPRFACPFEFSYRYRTADGDRHGTCQDWETEATFFKWRKTYGEEKTIQQMKHQFGEILPNRGLYFAMGTHSRHQDTWLINGLIQLKSSEQISLLLE